MDFTIKKYIEILNALKEQNYRFQTFENFVKKPADKVVILRHDVDRKPNNSYKIALIES